MLSEPDRDMEKLGDDHKTRRTAAIASLKVGWCLFYQAAGWGRTTVLGCRINPCAQTVTSTAFPWNNSYHVTVSIL